ncbi:MAG: hypothetical protein LQ340_003441, partial [Diploschistes diacapsis]
MSTAVAREPSSAPRDFSTEMGMIGSVAKRASTNKNRRRVKPEMIKGAMSTLVEARLTRNNTRLVVYHVSGSHGTGRLL